MTMLLISIDQQEVNIAWPWLHYSADLGNL